LALQGTLANIAAGIMLLWLRPFRLGDYIEIVSGAPFAGNVREIGLFACRLETFDGLYVFAPNSLIWTFPLRNHSRIRGRLVSFNIGFESGVDLEGAGAILLRTMSQQPSVLAAPAPDAFVASQSEGAPVLTCRLWAAVDGAGAVQRAILSAAQADLERADLKPKQLLRTIPADSDPSRFW
jgi:small conductance mechanosensitive channel